MQWDIYDYVAALLLVGSVVTVYRLGRRYLWRPRARIVLALGCGVLFILIWVELAVGILG